MKVKKYKTVKAVWKDLDKGIPIYWIHEGYGVVIEDVREKNEYQLKHFSHRNGKILCVRHLENWFGSILFESELPKLFSKGSAK